jgi:intracellular multiplication protein IcmE
MTDNFEEFEHTDTGREELPPVPTGFRANLTGAWRSQPLFKLFVLMVVVGAVVAVVVTLLSGNKGKSNVVLFAPPEIHEPPGGKSSPYLKEQTEMANKQRTQEAIQSGGSALPTPIGPGNDSSEAGLAGNKEDPLNELRAEVESMNKQLQEAKQAALQPPPPPPQQEPFDDTLAQAMQRQMGQLLDSWVPKPNKEVYVYDIDTLMRERDAEKDKEKQDQAGNGTGGAGAASSAVAHKTIVPAGTVSYAQLLTEANSDVPGPILAQVVSGPLKGARVVGQFQVTNGYSDYLVLTFKTADLNGVDYKINALALDPDTTLGGMATEVDQRYMTRLVLPAAAGFLQGFGQALGQGNENLVTNGTTTIIQNSGRGVRQGIYSGIGDAANTASQFFQNQANQTKPLVRVAAGTPMGLFFIDSVTDTPLQDLLRAEMSAMVHPYLPGTYPGGTMPYGNAQGYYGNQPYGNYAGAPNAYNALGNNSVPYPNYARQGYGVSYGGMGATNQSNLAYPGSTMYYTH